MASKALSGASSFGALAPTLIRTGYDRIRDCPLLNRYDHVRGIGIVAHSERKLTPASDDTARIFQPASIACQLVANDNDGGDLMVEKTLSGFQVKALNDFALALVDWQTNRRSLPEQAKAVAEIIGCTVEELFCCLHLVLCSVMSMERELDVFGSPQIDIEAAKEQMHESNKYGGWIVRFDEPRINEVARIV